MRYLALATDYDGTLATGGKVDEATTSALSRLKASGRRLLLVTGRQLGELQEVFDGVDLFDVVVAENGALLYEPATKQETLLGEAASEPLVQALRMRNATPLSVGRSVIATWEPNETIAVELIRELGLEWNVVFNKGAVMILPAGVTKATGLAAALKRMRLSPHNVVAVGDGENDHSLLQACELGAAVANAVPMLQERADMVTAGDHGAGVIEVIEGLLADDLAEVSAGVERHRIELGMRADGEKETIAPSGERLLIAGPSGSGKSTTARGLLERIDERGYQYCIVDPEGDYEDFGGAVTIGDAEHRADEHAVIELLEDADRNAMVNLLGIRLHDRPSFFGTLLPRVQELRTQLGHPHWLLIDEAHHLLPETWEPAPGILPQDLGNTMMVTVHPDLLSPAVLASVDVLIAVGDAAEERVRSFAEIVGEDAPSVEGERPDEEYVLLWRRREGGAAVFVKPTPPESEQHRHRRKYAEGDVQEKAFYFTGPEGKLNLRAQNLMLFIQMAEGVDDATWDYHLRRGDFSKWFRYAIKDEALADEAVAIERGAEGKDAAETKEGIVGAIEQRYTG